MKSAIASSDAVIAEHAAELLKTGAIEAVVGAVLVAAARDASVLFGPLHILVGGSGTGLFAVDGRVRQPGVGVVRPRGFREGDAIPAAAYVGVPAFAGAVFAALALTGNDSTLAVFSPAISAAKAISKPRSEILNRLARKGALALAENDVAGELVAVAGRVAGGVLTQEDLASVRPDVKPCQVVEHGDEAGSRKIAVSPWADEPERAVSSQIEVILAADARGQIAAACYETSTDVVPLAFDLAAPKYAEPVLRSEERVRPGAPLPSYAPLAIVRAGLWQAGLGLSRKQHGAALAKAVTVKGDIEAILAELGTGALAVQIAESRVRIVRG